MGLGWAEVSLTTVKLVVQFCAVLGPAPEQGVLDPSRAAPFTSPSMKKSKEIAEELLF